MLYAQLMVCVYFVCNRIERKERSRARTVKFQGKDADSTSVSLLFFSYHWAVNLAMLRELRVVDEAGCAIDVCMYALLLVLSSMNTSRLSSKNFLGCPCDGIFTSN